MDRSLNHPLYVLDSSHGLGSNQIHALALDGQSRLWLASPVGLVCYDGSFTHQWDRRNGMHCNGLRCVAVDAMDRVWVGTDRGVELVEPNGQVSEVLHSGAWNFGICEHIEVAGPDPWIACAQGMVRLQRHADGLNFEVNFSADVGFVSDIIRLRGGSVLAVSAAMGLVKSDGRTWWRYKCSSLAGRRVTCIKPGLRGEFLLGTDDGLLVVGEAGDRGVSRIQVPGADPTVTAIAVEGQTYWVAFGPTLAAFVETADGLSMVETFQLESQANDLLSDQFGNVWIGTDGSGLAKVSCLRHALERIDLGRSGGIYSIKTQARERYSIGGDRLFGRADLAPDTSSAKFTAIEGLPETVVWDSLEDNDGIWAATQAGLYRTNDAGRLAPAFADHVVLGAPNRVLLQRGESLLVGTLRGLARIRDDQVDILEAEGRSLGYVYTLFLDDSSVLWIGTLGRGLWREHDVLEPVLDGPLTADGNVYAVAQGPDGRFIVLQDENIVLLDLDRGARLVAQLPPVAGWTFVWLDAETIAIGGSDGLRIMDVGSGRIIRHVCSLFRLRHWEFTNNRTLVRDTRGRLLCGLTSGLARVDLDQLLGYEPPVCKLADIAWSGVEPVSVADQFRVPPGRWSFRLRAYSAWLVESGLVRYQFQLVGFDEDWSPLRDSLEAAYNSLPPGKYRLVARASSPLTGMGPESELLRLEVRSPLWALGSSAIVTAVQRLVEFVSRSRSRNQRMLQEQARLEREVSERTLVLRSANLELEKVRDAFEKLSEVDELTQLGNRRHFDKELTRALTLTRRLNTPLALLMVDVDHFKSVNDRLGHPTGDEYLRQVAGTLAATVREGEDVAARFGGEEFAILLLSTDEASAAAGAERLRVAVAGLALPNPGAPGGFVTVSIGVALARAEAHVDGDGLMLRADQALYRAKREGRNRVALEVPADPSADPD